MTPSSLILTMGNKPDPSGDERLSLLFASDIHFGASSVDQGELAIAFATTIFPLIQDTDIFFINGDLFDGPVIFDNQGFDPIYETILNLFALCEQHRTALRVLQGTWSHDRNQCKRLEAFYRNSKSTFDFRFIGAIEVEEIVLPTRNLRVVYAPDSLPHQSSDDIIDVMRAKMGERGWEKVDYACLHGLFDFTMPKGLNPTGAIVYKEDQFDFVNKAINVGHVHHYRSVGRVISNGSFDRLCCGEEEPKGCVRVFDHPDHYTAQFIENKQAAIFDTLYFRAEDDTDAIRVRIATHITNLHTTRQIALRFIVDDTEKYEAIKTWMREFHPQIKISRKKSGDKEDGHLMIPTSSLIAPVERRIAPTPQTIAVFVREHIPEDYAITIEEIEARLEPPAK